MRIKLLNDGALIPTRSTNTSIGYAITSVHKHDITIEPGQIKIILASLIIEYPTGTYAQIAPRSGLTVNNQITSLAGVINPDCRGKVKDVLNNFGTTTQYVRYKQQVEQFIFEQAKTPNIELTENLTSTTQYNDIFGSTEKRNPHNNNQDNLVDICIRENIDLVYELTTASAAKLDADI